MMTRLTIRVLALCAGQASLASARLAAQTARPEIAAGVAVPAGALAAQRVAGPLVRAGVVLGAPSRIVRVRLDAEAAWMPARGRTVPISSASGTLRTVGAVASMLVGPAEPRIAPYLLAGISAQRMQVNGHPNPYGTLAGVRLGVGVRRTVGTHELRAEVAEHAVLSDYGTGRDFAVGTYWPISFGVTF